MVVVGFPWPANQAKAPLGNQKWQLFLLRFEATQTAAFYQHLWHYPTTCQKVGPFIYCTAVKNLGKLGVPKSCQTWPPETSGSARMLLNWLACWGYVYSFSVENIWIDIAATNSPWPAAACSFEASKPAEYERQQHDYVLQPRKRYSLSLEAIWSDKRTLRL